MGLLVANAPTGGTCAARFQPVADVFAENFAERGEVGAAVSAYLDGVRVVDLWGGHRDAARERPWQPDTLVAMQSVTKGMAALCAHALVEEGKLDLEAPVASYWPEFAQAGKAEITAKQLISHLAGLLYADDAPAGSYLDWDVMVDALARQKPEWPPGAQGAYHSATYGHLVGELIRRASGETFAQIVKRRFTDPLAIEYLIGVTDREQDRVSALIVNAGSVTMTQKADLKTKLGRAWRPEQGIDPVRRQRAEYGSLTGYSNAGSVSRLYAALARGGEIDGVRVLQASTVEALRVEQWAGICGMTDRRFRMAVGLFLNSGAAARLGPNPDSFGHPGAGGVVGFADPDLKMSFGYSPNFMCAGAGLGDRCEALIDALYRCV